MATGNLSAQLRKTMKNSMRKRGTEISEKKVDCSFAGCEENLKLLELSQNISKIHIQPVQC